MITNSFTKRHVCAAGSGLLVAAVLLGPGAASIRAQDKPPARTQLPAPQQHKFAFHAVHYDVTATLNPSDQSLSAQAKVTLQANTSSREVEVELHPNLRVNSVVSAGKPVTFEREPDTPLLVKATLPAPATVGDKIELVFDYAGPLANEEGSPIKGVSVAHIGADGAYLLLPARWFPLTGYPSNRYTAVFNLIVPDNFAVAGTGISSGAPSPVAAGNRAAGQGGKSEGPGGQAARAGGRLLYKFVCDHPAPVGTFVAGNIQLTPVRAQGLEINVYTQPSAVNTAKEYGEAVADIITFFSSDIGPLEEPHLSVAQLPEGAVQSYAAPGLLLINQKEWSSKVNDRLLARLVAAQWWSNQVIPATNNDEWLADGLSRYSEALYAEHSRGKEGLRASLDDCAVGALMDEEAAPIAQAGRLDPFTTGYNSVVVNKGAMVFHMLRTSLGDEAFAALLHDYYAKFSRKRATLDDFEKLVQAKAATISTPADQPKLNLVAFFTQWLNSTGIPEFHLEYIVYRTSAPQKGFKIVGKVKQELETLNMPVEVRVDTEGNPEYKTIRVVGTTSEFAIETFGRPKPGGITLDPNNNILKSSGKLRVRAMIAQGEELAQNGQFYDAVQEYQRALDIQKNNALALFRMAEVLFYQKNYQAAANAFRDASDGEMEPAYKWVEVWSHIYLGKIFDLTGQRERALNEYQKAKQTNDNTDGAQAEADRYLQKPYAGDTAAASTHPGA